MDGMDVFIYFVVCISSIIKFISNKMINIYINLNVKSVKREESEIILQIPFGFLHRLYRVFCKSIPTSYT